MADDSEPDFTSFHSKSWRYRSVQHREIYNRLGYVYFNRF